MKHSQSKVVLLTTAVALLFIFSESVAADVQLKLIQPEKFRDIDIAGYSKSKTISVIETELKSLFNNMSQDRIKKGDTLSIEVLDVDLAGYIEYFWGNTNREIRLIRDHDRYRLKFRFELKNASNKVLQSGEKSIKRFANMRKGSINKSKSDRFAYFERSLKHWFENELTN